MQVIHCTISYIDPNNISTVVGEVDNLAEAHEMIVDDVKRSREIIKAAWEKHFNFPWPAYGSEITMTQRVINGVVVITVNSSEIEWYELR